MERDGVAYAVDARQKYKSAFSLILPLLSRTCSAHTETSHFWCGIHPITGLCRGLKFNTDLLVSHQFEVLPFNTMLVLVTLVIAYYNILNMPSTPTAHLLLRHPTWVFNIFVLLE